VAGVVQTGIGPSEQLGSAAPLPFVGPGSYGAGLGAELEQAGSALHQDKVRAMRIEKQRQQESENAAAAAATAQLSIDLNKDALAARDAAPADGAGHVDQVSKSADARIQQFLGTITDERVREHWAPRAAEMRANLINDEEGWSRGKRLQSIGDNAKEAQRLGGNALQSKPDPVALEQYFKDGDTFWAAADAPVDLKKEGLRQWKANGAENYATGLTEQDPHAALAVLQSGTFDPWLETDNKRQLIDRAETGVRVAEADARRVQSQALSQLHEDVTEYKQRVDRGELPSDDETKTLVGRAQALGDKNVIDDVQYSSGKLKFSRLTDKWTSAEWEHNVNTLAAKVAGGKSSAEEQQELKILQELRPAKEQRFRSDPDGFASASGMPPPQVDIANPDAGSINARKAWARSFARTGGLIEPPYLNKDQLQAYRDRAGQGPVGQLEVAQELRQSWGDAAPSIVRQIGGEPKGDMLIMLGLNPRMAQVYRGGAEALAKKTVKFNDDKARAVWADYANAVPPDVRPALFDAARNIAAGWMNEQGKTEPTADFDQVFRQAIHRAAGMLGSAGEGSATGGFVKWNGRYAWLPPELGRTELQARISRAAPHDWVNAAVDVAGNPVNSVPHHLGSDGKPKPYTIGEATRFASGTLQTVAPGIYRLVDPTGAVAVDAQGRPWQFDIRKLGSRFDTVLAAHGYSRH
jgi:hypothetical protein